MTKGSEALFPQSALSGAEVLERLLQKDRELIAKRRKPRISDDGVKFDREDWALVAPWMLTLRNAMEQGFAGEALLRQVLLGPTDGEYYEAMMAEKTQ